jgi:hypothetical protein|tara:strand:+ start:1313 stop:1510 length:198 start_codon:yes stop_codon:yes gene_type:complete
MYVLSRAINKEEFIFYVMNENNRPVKAKIEKLWIGQAIEMTRKYAAENNITAWEINTERGREIVD